MPRKCGRRSRLYARELAQTADYLRDLLGDPPFSRTDAQRLAPALADKALVDALEDILVPYAVYGVARDLARLKKSRVLFLKDTDATSCPTWTRSCLWTAHRRRTRKPGALSIPP